MLGGRHRQYFKHEMAVDSISSDILKNLHKYWLNKYLLLIGLDTLFKQTELGQIGWFVLECMLDFQTEILSMLWYYTIAQNVHIPVC